MNILSYYVCISFGISVCWSCSCSKSSSLRDTFCSSSFSAVIFIKDISSTCFDWHSCYEVTVRRRFKPSSGVVREIVTSNNTAGCGYQFQPNEEYFVMGHLLESFSSKAEVYSCSFPIFWSSLSYTERKEILTEIQPKQDCVKKRKRVL